MDFLRSAYARSISSGDMTLAGIGCMGIAGITGLVDVMGLGTAGGGVGRR